MRTSGLVSDRHFLHGRSSFGFCSVTDKLTSHRLQRCGFVRCLSVKRCMYVVYLYGCVCILSVRPVSRWNVHCVTLFVCVTSYNFICPLRIYLYNIARGLFVCQFIFLETEWTTSFPVSLDCQH